VIVHNEEGVDITVTVAQKEHIAIIVEDDGKGISQEDLSRIFDRYYRGTNTGEAHKGSGLEMAIAQDIIHAHQDEINIHSTQGIGTRVEIQL
jgi:signal transduction histidine kinase